MKRVIASNNASTKVRSLKQGSRIVTPAGYQIYITVMKVFFNPASTSLELKLGMYLQEWKENSSGGYWKDVFNIFEGSTQDFIDLYNMTEAEVESRRK